jgi:hypothetical protein
MITLLVNVASMKSRSVPKTFRDTLSLLIVSIGHLWTSVTVELTINN